MKEILLIFAVMISAVFLLTGCQTGAGTVINNYDIQGITLENAMVQIAHSLNKMYDVGQGYQQVGLVPSEVVVDFDISAVGTSNNNLTIGVSNPTIVMSPKASAGFDRNLQATRSNHITITLTNLFASSLKDSLILNKKPDEIVELLDKLKKAGYVPVVRK